MSVARIAALTYYPVKGLAGVSVEQAEVGPTGLRHDRNFMLIEPDGTFLSQRSLPAMAALRAEILGDSVRFSADGAPDLEVPIQYDGKRRDVSLFGKWFGQGVVQDPAADEWFTERLDKPAALVRVTPEHDRPGWGVHAGRTGAAHVRRLSRDRVRGALDQVRRANRRPVDGGEARSRADSHAGVVPTATGLRRRRQLRHEGRSTCRRHPSRRRRARRTRLDP